MKLTDKEREYLYAKADGLPYLILKRFEESEQAAWQEAEQLGERVATLMCDCQREKSMRHSLAVEVELQRKRAVAAEAKVEAFKALLQDSILDCES